MLSSRKNLIFLLCLISTSILVGHPSFSETTISEQKLAGDIIIKEMYEPGSGLPVIFESARITSDRYLIEMTTISAQNTTEATPYALWVVAARPAWSNVSRRTRSKKAASLSFDSGKPPSM